MSIAFLVFFKIFSCAKILQKAHVSALYLGNPLVFCPKLPKILASVFGLFAALPFKKDPSEKSEGSRERFNYLPAMMSRIAATSAMDTPPSPLMSAKSVTSALPAIMSRAAATSAMVTPASPFTSPEMDSPT